MFIHVFYENSSVKIATDKFQELKFSKIKSVDFHFFFLNLENRKILNSKKF